MTDTAPPSACATHPAQQAFVSCRRCGRAACAYCLPESAGGQTCTECVALDELPTVIAWERRDLNVLLRFWRTTRDVLSKSQATFALLGDGSVMSAIGYSAALHVVLCVAALLLVSPCVLLAALGWQTPVLGPTSPFVAGLFVGASCGAPVLAALAGVLDALLVGTLFHAASRALGGTGSYSLSVRAAAYALAVGAIWLVLAPGVALPVVGPLVLGVACLAQLVWLGSVLTNVARERHALGGPRARIAGFAPSAVIFAFLVAVLVATQLASGVLDPTQGPDVYR